MKPLFIIWIILLTLIPNTWSNNFDNFKNYLPNTYNKLINKKDIHFLVIGDGITTISEPKNSFNDDIIITSSRPKTFYETFAETLSIEFSYFGDIINYNNNDHIPQTKRPTISFESRGTKKNFTIQAWQQLSKQNTKEPDFVLIAFGNWDMINKTSISQFEFNIKSIINFLKNKKKEIILCSPVLSIIYPLEQNLGKLILYRDSLKKISQEQNVILIDFLEKSLFEIGFGFSNKENLKTTFLQRSKKLFHNYENNHKFISLTSENLTHTTHQKLGTHIFKILNKAHNNSLFSNLLTISGNTELNNETNEITASFILKNNSKNKKHGSLLPLITDHNFIPDIKKIQYSLKPNEEKEFELNYKKIQDNFENFINFGFYEKYNQIINTNDTSHFPFLVSDDEFYNIINAKSTISPFLVTIQKKKLSYTQNETSINIDIHNSTKKNYENEYVATWHKREKNLTKKINAFTSIDTIKIPPQDSTTLNLKIPIEENLQKNKAEQKRIIDKNLILKLKHDENNFEFPFKIQMFKHLTLNKTYPLYNINQYFFRTFPKHNKTDVNIKINADKEFLFINFYLKNIQPTDNSVFQFPNIFIKLFIDARNQKRIHKSGNVGSIDFLIWLKDNITKINSDKFGTFGESYFFPFSNEYVKTSINPLENNKGKKITIVFSKKAFYRHEWLVNQDERPNSTLGLNAIVKILDTSKNKYPVTNQYQLIINYFNEYDPQSLLPINLSEKDSHKWSIYSY